MRHALLLVIVVLAACDKNDDCKRAVNHLFDITTMSPPGVKNSKPSDEEQQVIDMVKTTSLSGCRKEGLDPAARDCILAMKALADLEKLGDCPGIIAHHPSWVMASPSADRP